MHTHKQQIASSLLPPFFHIRLDVFQIWKAIIFHQKLEGPTKDKILFTFVVPNTEEVEAFYSTFQSPLLPLTTAVHSDYLKIISKASEIHFRGYQQGVDW